MSTGVTAALYVNGERFADGSPGDDLTNPVALSGLTVVWGRDTTIDQPAPSTCTFTVADNQGGESFLGILHTGLPLEVTATGVDYPAPSLPTFADPGFESDPVTAAPANATAAASSRQVHGGARALQVLPVDGLRRWSVTLPPAPFVPAGTDPGAWDGIPQTTPGQDWQVGAWIYAPAGVTVTVRPVLYTGPWSNAGLPVGTPTTLTDAGQWVLVSGTHHAETTGSWVGLEVSAFPTGPTWVDLDSTTWSDVPAASSWLDLAAVYIDDVTVLAPDAGTPRTVLVFAGRITNMAAAWDDTIGGPAIIVTAADFTTDLDNRDVGDEPWLVEPMADRFNRILTLAGMPVIADIAATVADIPVSWVDVDNQAATGLLQNLATSVDAVMWPAVHQATGAYLKVEDPTNRAALYHLELVDGVVQVVATGTGGHTLSACDVLRDPIQFVQDVSDIVTRAAVSWLEQGVDTDGLATTTEHTETVIDATLETSYGTRRISVTTELTAAADAVDVANRLLARLTAGAWRADGFTVDDLLLDYAEQMLTLLDGTSRIGLPIRVTDLPDWSPAGPVLPVYLEGGSYTYDAGRWLLNLQVSSARGQGESAVWSELDPAWAWNEFDPALSWSELFGVDA